MEIFVVPGTAVFGIGGLFLILLSLIMATQDFFLPETNPQWQQLQTNTLIIVGSLMLVGIIFMVQLLVLDSIPGLSRFQLKAPNIANSDMASSSLVAGSSPPSYTPEIGAIGLADSVLRPSGKVLFGSQLVDVISDGDYIDPGTSVEVLRCEGNRIIVRRVR
jgi:membrane-bound serine protease (ClpP class)